MSDPVALADKLIGGDRRALARAITLVESRHADHRADAIALLDAIMPSTGKAMRVGISGAPGAGKSTLLEALGVAAAEAGRDVAVLAVDPSSARSKGSILGDKTRMERLARHPRAFIRPTPSGGALGGVARRTREALLVCEAAGFDSVFVETVGTGQAQTEVADMVDVFVLLVQPGAGDELQGIKRGVMEMADVVAVTKADGELLAAAAHTASDHRTALSLLQPKHRAWRPEVVLCSARTGDGIDDLARTIERCHSILTESGELATQRSQQAVSWFWSELTQELLSRFRQRPDVRAQLSSVERQVAEGVLPPAAAAAALLDG